MMKILSVFDPEFKPYGEVVKGFDVAPLVAYLEKETPCPEGVQYVPTDAGLEALPQSKELMNNLFGGMPAQLGWCNGHNTKLNCMEYHRDSEFNLGTTDFILLLATRWELENGALDTAKVRAFRCPKNTLLEVYATTLHYAPCNAGRNDGFRVMVALPRGTNEAAPQLEPKSQEDRTLWACNKWLLAHADSDEAAQKAYVGLKGENTDIADSL